MNRWDKFSAVVSVAGLPLVLMMALVNSLLGEETIRQRSSFVQFYYNGSGIVFALWMSVALYVSIKMVLSPGFREAVSRKIALVRDRDEREALLAGEAARRSFLATLALLVCLLCLSVFQVSLYDVKPEKRVDGKRRTITLGFDLRLWDSGKAAPADEAPAERHYLEHSGLPISKT